MIKEYPYKLPLYYIFIGFIGISIAILFGSMIGHDAIWISIFFGVLMTLTAVIGILFLYTTLINLNIHTLKVSPQYIQLPKPHNKYIQIYFENIDHVDVVTNKNGKLIEIYTKNGDAFLIDQKWMKKKDFIEVSNRLNEWKG